MRLKGLQTPVCTDKTPKSLRITTSREEAPKGNGQAEWVHVGCSASAERGPTRPRGPQASVQHWARPCGIHQTAGAAARPPVQLQKAALAARGEMILRSFQCPSWHLLHRALVAPARYSPPAPSLSQTHFLPPDSSPLGGPSTCATALQSDSDQLIPSSLCSSHPDRQCCVPPVC